MTIIQKNQGGLKLNKHKKSQSIAINTIIVAAIALGVLVVTFIIFTSHTSSTAKTLQSCELKGGKCAKDLESNKNIQKLTCNDKEYNVPIILNDPACGESKLCCLKIG